MDPYYQRDPPKLSNVPNTDQGHGKPKHVAEPKRIERVPSTPSHPEGKAVYYYDCHECGREFSSATRRHSLHTFCGRKCSYTWMSRYMATHHNTPEYRVQQSIRASEVASRPEWKRKQSERMKGRVVRRETGQKISRSKMGHAVSQETRNKLSIIFRGEGSYFYKDGRSSDRQRFYRSTYWRSQCKRAKDRDRLTCQGCGWTEKEAGPLGVHHIEPLSITKYNPEDYPDELVVTLCRSCHSKSDLGPGYYKYPLNARGAEAKPDRISPLKPWIDFLEKRDNAKHTPDS